MGDPFWGTRFWCTLMGDRFWGDTWGREPRGPFRELWGTFWGRGGGLCGPGGGPFGTIIGPLLGSISEFFLNLLEELCSIWTGVY